MKLTKKLLAPFAVLALMAALWSPASVYAQDDAPAATAVADAGAVAVGRAVIHRIGLTHDDDRA